MKLSSLAEVNQLKDWLFNLKRYDKTLIKGSGLSLFPRELPPTLAEYLQEALTKGIADIKARLKELGVDA